MSVPHSYTLSLDWTGNLGQGTASYRAYSRAYSIRIPGKEDILGSSDVAFRGDPERHNPEEMLLAAVSSCHLLWFLHLCADAGVVVCGYSDQPEGILQINPDGGGYFSEITLRIRITVAHIDMIERANALHSEANRLCFIANSLNFPVRHEVNCGVVEGGA